MASDAFRVKSFHISNTCAKMGAQVAALRELEKEKGTLDPSNEEHMAAFKKRAIAIHNARK